MLRDLSDPDPARRDDARERLLAIAADEFPALKAAAIASKPLSPTQLDAIRNGVMHAYLKSLPYDADATSGFLGITLVGTNPNQPFEPDPTSRGIVVTERWPGYGAFETLRDGDVILRITDRPDVPVTTQLFPIAMNGRASGTTIGLEILRDGTVRYVDVRLSARPKRVDGEENFRLAQMSRVALGNAFFAKEFGEIAKDAAVSP